MFKSIKYYFLITKNYFYNHKREISLAIIIILLMSLSFALGYLIAINTNQTPIIIQKFSN